MELVPAASATVCACMCNVSLLRLQLCVPVPCVGALKYVALLGVECVVFIYIYVVYRCFIAATATVLNIRGAWKVNPM